jgi:hypothetical protein
MFGSDSARAMSLQHPCRKCSKMSQTDPPRPGTCQQQSFGCARLLCDGECARIGRHGPNHLCHMGSLLVGPRDSMFDSDRPKIEESSNMLHIVI